MLDEMIGRRKTTNASGAEDSTGTQMLVNGEAPHIKSAAWTITPDLAHELLSRNFGDDYKNRPVSQNSVKRFARAMERGWKLTGEPLIISSSGYLLNGQHRLYACIKANVPFQTMMVFNVDDDAFAYMDQGRRRDASDIFSICEVPNAKLIAPAIRWIWRYQYTGMNYPSADQAPENDELYDLYVLNQRIQESVSYGKMFSTGQYGLSSPSLMTALHYLCAQQHRSLADAFFEKTASGIGILSGKEPEKKLRDLLEHNKTSKDKTPSLWIAAFTIQAWNAKRTNTTLKIFRWRTQQNPRERFPKVK